MVFRSAAQERLGGLLGLVLGMLACAPAPDGFRDPRHVIFISMDTTRADHLGFMGNDRIQTPRLDELTARSIVFEDCMTVAPTTLASHTSLFTGKYPHSHGTPRNGFLVNPKNVMLAEVLGDAGFHTAGFAGSFALHSRFAFAQGFDHYDETFDQRVGEGGVDQNQRSAAVVTDAVRDYLALTGIPERLFLFVHYFDPHRPYAAPEPFATAYDPDGRDALPDIESIRRDRGLTPGERQQAGRRQMLQYAAEISFMDEQIGRLLDVLDASGVLDEALLVLTSDHGENLLERSPIFDHGNSVYRAMTDAVCAIRLPGGRGATRVPGTMATIDILPSVLALLDIPAPEGVQGETIDLEEHPLEIEPRTRFAQATKPWDQVETDPRWTNLRKARCIRDGRYKLIQVPYLGTEELYDLQEDPEETVNLLDAGDPPAITGILRRRLEVWAESADPLPSHFMRGRRDENIERLRSLGYVE